MAAKTLFQRKPYLLIVLFMSPLLIVPFLLYLLDRTPWRDPAVRGLSSGVRVTLSDSHKPPYVITYSTSEETATAEAKHSHEVFLVDRDQKIIRLRSVDGSHHEVTISFHWIAAVRDTAPASE